MGCAVPRCANHANRGSRPVTTRRYCAEHSHEIPSFERSSERLRDLSECEEWLTFDKKNAKGISKVLVAVGVGVTVVAPLALVAAPTVGGAIGGYLGLTGAAATSKGLALLGGGAVAAGGLGMAGGTAVVTATGAALGGTMGAVVTTAYVGGDKSFRLVKLRDGTGAPVILANGFLTDGQGHEHWGAWRRLIDERYSERPVYRLHWGAKELKALGMVAGTLAGEQALLASLTTAAKVASKKTSLGPLAAVLGAKGVAANPWHVAKNRADMTAAVLADLIARSDEGPYVLVGHSLGGRIMAQTSIFLSTKSGGPYVEDVHLLGAAIGRKGEWTRLHEAVRGSIYNYWSKNDKVLKYLYVGAQMGEQAVGRVGFGSTWSNIRDRNKSSQIKGHSEYFAKVKLESAPAG